MTPAPAATAAAGAGAGAADDAVPSPLQYHVALRAPLETAVGAAPRAPAHGAEIARVAAGLPVEINPSVGSGYKVMDWTEVRGFG